MYTSLNILTDFKTCARLWSFDQASLAWSCKNYANRDIVKKISLTVCGKTLQTDPLVMWTMNTQRVLLSRVRTTHRSSCPSWLRNTSPRRPAPAAPPRPWPFGTFPSWSVPSFPLICCLSCYCGTCFWASLQSWRIRRPRCPRHPLPPRSTWRQLWVCSIWKTLFYGFSKMSHQNIFIAVKVKYATL